MIKEKAQNHAIIINRLEDHEKVTSYEWISDLNAWRYLGALTYIRASSVFFLIPEFRPSGITYVQALRYIAHITILYSLNKTMSANFYFLLCV
jgi:hypothetical protein